MVQSVQRPTTGWSLERLEFESRYGQNYLLSSPRRSHRLSSPLSVFLLGAKKMGRETDLSLTISAEVNKKCLII
jgi:hypothetical protein